METQTQQDKFQIEREAALVRVNQSKAQWSTDRKKAQVKQAEVERVDAVAAKISHTVSALFFTEKSVERLQHEFDALDPSGWDDKRTKECLAAAKRQVSEFKAYLDEQRTAGDFSASEIDAEVSRFAVKQGAPERLAKAASSAAKKIENDAKPQPIPGGPLVTYSCEKCGAELSNPNLPLHLNGNSVWCVRNVRKAFATGRDAHWLLFEGNITVEELREAGIAVPNLQ